MAVLDIKILQSRPRLGEVGVIRKMNEVDALRYAGLGLVEVLNQTRQEELYVADERTDLRDDGSSDPEATDTGVE